MGHKKKALDASVDAFLIDKDPVKAAQAKVPGIMALVLLSTVVMAYGLCCSSYVAPT